MSQATYDSKSHKYLVVSAEHADAATPNTVHTTKKRNWDQAFLDEESQKTHEDLGQSVAIHQLPRATS